MGQMFLMHACSLLMPSVSRMGLCGSLFVVFFMILFQRLVTNFSFDLSLRKFKFESTSSFFLMIFFVNFYNVLKRVPAFVWESVRVCGCPGVWVCC